MTDGGVWDDRMGACGVGEVGMGLGAVLGEIPAAGRGYDEERGAGLAEERGVWGGGGGEA